LAAEFTPPPAPPLSEAVAIPVNTQPSKAIKSSMLYFQS